MLKKYLHGIVLVLIAFFGVKTGVENFKSSVNIRSNDAAVVIWDERLSNLLTPIPFKRGVIGYVSIEDIPGAIFDEADTSGEFVLTQYAIAPLVLTHGANQEWDILNLDPENFEKWLQGNVNNFEVIRSGGGMYLVRKVGQ